MQIPPGGFPLSKKSIPFKAASAVFAGLLVLGSGIAVAGAHDDESTHEPTEVVSEPTDPSLVAEPDTDVEDDTAVETDDTDAGETDPVKDEVGDDADDALDDKPVVDDGEGDDDSDVIEVTLDGGDDADQDDAADGADHDEAKAPHPDNHGAQVSQAAHQKDVVAGSDARNHGATVSAVARDKAHGNDEDGTDSPPSVGDENDDQGKVKDKGDDVEDDDEDDE